MHLYPWKGSPYCPNAHATICSLYQYLWGEAEGPGPHVISLQDIQAPGPVQDIIHLVQVQEYFVDLLIPHVYYLLEQFDLKVGGPCTATRP